jgi:hypothetical protein
MLERGFISLSDSNYGSPTFSIAKKDRTQHIVQDFHELNKYTVKDVTPLPDICQAIEGLGDKSSSVNSTYERATITSKSYQKIGGKPHSKHTGDSLSST